MASRLVEMELKQAGNVRVEINEQESELLREGSHVLDFLAGTGRGDLERRVVINHVCNCLYADILHFTYEGLRALEKRKFTVAFALLRKPMKEGILMAAQMCSDEDDFFRKLKFNPKSLLDNKELGKEKIVRIITSALEKCKFDLAQSEVIYDLLFERGRDDGLAPLFDKATHFITGYTKIRTEDYNINFIFKDPFDNDVYRGSSYPIIGIALMLLNVMQLELCARMGEIDQKRRNWLMISSLGAYQALFIGGRPKLLGLMNSVLKEFLQCPNCGQSLRILKQDAPRFFIGELVECSHCRSWHHFPLAWLLSKVDFEL